MPTDQSPTVIHYHLLKNIPVPIQALVEAGLSPTQWTLLYLIHHPELRTEILAMIHCPNKALLWTSDDMQDLVDRFYLVHEPVPGAATRTDLANFRCSERFTDLLHMVKESWLPGTVSVAKARVPKPSSWNPAVRAASVDALELRPSKAVLAPSIADLDAFDELFQAYPAHIYVQGELVSGRSSDYDTMAAAYAKALASKQALSHPEILDLVAWARNAGRITMGLQKFIGSREWLGLQELRDQGFAGGSFDNTTAI